MGKDFNESVNVLFNKVEDLVSTKTVVGEAIVIGDLTILPMIEVNVGAGAGAKENVNAAGGVGAKITPTAVLVIQKGTVQIMHIKNQDAVSKLIDMAPGIATKLNFASIFGNRNNEDTEVSFEEELVVEPFDKKE